MNDQSESNEQLNTTPGVSAQRGARGKQPVLLSVRLAFLVCMVPVPLFVICLIGWIEPESAAWLALYYELLVGLLLVISWIVDRSLTEWVKQRKPSARTIGEIGLQREASLQGGVDAARRAGRIMQIGGVSLLIISLVFAVVRGTAVEGLLDFSHFFVGAVAFLAAGTDVRQRGAIRAAKAPQESSP
jgi:hypothetical protein